MYFGCIFSPKAIKWLIFGNSKFECPFWCFYQYMSVAEHPFLNVSYKHERPGTVVVNEGRKRIVLEPKVNAVPQPDVTLWCVKPTNARDAIFSLYLMGPDAAV